ncbi:MAG: VWA domain-containing protein [Planctomycetia bacterium]|nr:VWA domain-containing protein [Planctomycetia bacterium]
MFARLVFCGAIWLCFSQIAFAIDHLEDFRQARQSLQQQLRSKQPADRIAALKRLQDFPIADSARLIQNSLNDPADEVHAAAYNALLTLTGNQEVCDTLMQAAKKAIHRKDDGQSAVPLLSLLLASNLPSVQRDTNEFLEKSALSAKGGVPVMMTLADELGNHHGQSAVLPLMRLSKTKIFANHFGLRRAVAHALTRIQQPQAVGALIELAGVVHGEVQADIVEHLTQVTGQIFGLESAAWARWWEENKDTFEYPKRSAETPYRSVGLNSSGSYYGLPVFAERLVFVLDTSGSMTGQRIMAAKRELIKAIGNLPERASFGIVVFNSSVSVWQKQLVPATQNAKLAAIAYVGSQDTAANTASYDALETAFNFDTEAIYFLSDGAPNGGKIPAPVDIVAAITAINRVRRVSLYTIGIGVGFPGGPLDLFLKTLAEQNLGLYRRVDQ